MTSYMPTVTADATPQPAKSALLPPTSIPPPSEFLAHLPQEAVSSPTALRFPAAWRCGTCANLHSVLVLLAGPTTTTSAAAAAGHLGRRRGEEDEEEEDDDDDEDEGKEGSHHRHRNDHHHHHHHHHHNRQLCPCGRPALQAVYDQFGELYLFWRDDPAVSDLSVPRMAEEARWRVRTAGADGWFGGWSASGRLL
ncbi:uncharacterized protein P884DRAFT_300333 [Thermothelomyces heterothallicus CBS 202.75]|uniref:uncharacterized protein n=1 Tax=Thermothelomyces heterothallicus CBS 202.75 TaxID=1149848 RepID=UPI003744877C